MATGIEKSIRKSIYESLIQVLVKNRPRDQELNGLIESLKDSSKSKGFATDLFYGSLQNFGYFDAVRKNVLGDRKWPIPLQVISAMSLYQIHKMDSVPDYAAVNEGIKLIPSKYRGLKGALNFLLRESQRNPSALNIDRFLPPWYEELLKKVFSTEEIVRLQDLILQKPVQYYCFNKFDESGLGVESNELLKGIHYANSLNRSQAELIESNGGVVCDLWSLYLPTLLKTHQSKHLDLCSAPGGKLLRALNLNLASDFVAVELSDKRCKRLESRLKRAEYQNCRIHQSEALAFLKDQKEKSFETIYLDPPCSALGTIPAHPEYLFDKESQNFSQNVELQMMLLKEASRVLSDTGQILFSTCTFNPQEGEKFSLSEIGLQEVEIPCGELESSWYKKASQGVYFKPVHPGGQYFYALLLAKGQRG